MAYVPIGQSDYKLSVRVATTASITLSAPGSTIDGVTLAAGNRILVKNQSPASGNGIYRFVAAASPLVRTSDADSAGELSSGSQIFVSEGTTNSGKLFFLTTADPITIGTTDLVFSELNVAVSGAIPIGGTVDYFGASEPTGWFFPNGQELSISTYTTLYNTLTASGTTFPFGANTNGSGGAGSTHFRVPDLRGKSAVMRDLSAGVLTGTDTIGTTGGAQTVALTAAETAVKNHTHSGTTSTESAGHSHSGTTGDDNIDHGHSGTTGTVSSDHGHNTSSGGSFLQNDNSRLINTTAGTSYRMSFTGVGTSGITANHTHGFSTGGRSAFHQHAFTSGGVSANHTHTMTTGNPVGGEANGSAHQNMQPHMRVNKLIRAV